jgi:hypothetical protein
MSKKQFQVSSSIGQDFGVTVWLPAGMTVKNRDGDTVPGMLLSIEQARQLARSIRGEAKRLEVMLEMG